MSFIKYDSFDEFLFLEEEEISEEGEEALVMAETAEDASFRT